jgi:hypothetical protein
MGREPKLAFVVDIRSGASDPFQIAAMLRNKTPFALVIAS